MNPSSPTDDHLRAGPAGDLDRLLSDFFKGQMPRPWPTAATATAEPAVPVTVSPATGRDPGRKSRYTLAASVALLLGTCWALSNGFQPGDRPGTGAVTGPKVPGVVTGATAADPPALKELRDDKAKAGDARPFVPPPIKLGP